MNGLINSEFVGSGTLFLFIYKSILMTSGGDRNHHHFMINDTYSRLSLGAFFFLSFFFNSFFRWHFYFLKKEKIIWSTYTYTYTYFFLEKQFNFDRWQNVSVVVRYDLLLEQQNALFWHKRNNSFPILIVIGHVTI